MFQAKLALILVLKLILATQQALGCDLHEGMGFGVFAGGKSIYGEPKPAYRAPQMKLFHPYFIRVNTGESRQMDIDYHTPLGFEQAKLKVAASEGLSLASQEEFALEKPDGSHTLVFTASKAGKQTVTLVLESVHEGKPVSLTRLILVTAMAAD